MTIAVLGITVGMAGCQRTQHPSASVVLQRQQTVPNAAPQQSPTKSLSEIDLTKIGHLAPKGRVQDKDYDESPVVDDLII